MCVVYNFPIFVSYWYNPVDVDQNGTIEFDEFLMLMAHKIQRVDEQEDLLTAFRVFDKNGDGYISASELKSVMESLGEEMTDEQIHEMIREADTDGNGLIDYSEFMYVLLLCLYVCYTPNDDDEHYTTARSCPNECTAQTPHLF